MPVWVGTSGWMYDDWRGQLYPADVPKREWLAAYAQQFETVECNNAFYRLPSPEVFAGWRDATPPGFRMALKASRFLTHIKRLRDPAEPVARLLEHAAGLGDRLGPILLQLPPNLGAEPGRLADCLAQFPAAVRVAVEPRHPSWWSDPVADVLADHGAALVWADQLGRPVTPLWRTASFGYLRCHAGAANPSPRYGRQALAHWARRIAGTWSGDADVYVYFNNDLGGAAVADAGTFAREAVRAGLAVSRTRVAARTR